MKKVILSFLCLIFAASSFAQFISQYGDTVYVNYSGSNTINVHNDLKSATSAGIYVKWRISGYNLSSGWALTSFCDNNICYNYTPDLLNGVSWQISGSYENQSFESFYATFDAANASFGSAAWIKVQANDTANLYSKTFTFVATKYPTSVSSLDKNEEAVSLYPNPARSHLNVVFDGSLGVKNIAVYNLIGKAVKVYKVNGNSAKLELNDIPNGIYFVRLMNAQGQIVATRKFTRQ